ncbi:leucine-rich repeat-containing protein [Tanacetum coccineum]
MVARQRGKSVGNSQRSGPYSRDFPRILPWEKPVCVVVVGAAHTCIDKERQALLDFKAPLQDPRNVLSTWRPEEEDDCCQWLGVTCNNQIGHVTAID